ncbi:hypothetical protein DFS34DRAFT_594610 [Phlyctochytrium arcticum]|nr:hypothetical protein DFS34DRAFT_594610 [Phlyctochytrium arcticum]
MQCPHLIHWGTAAYPPARDDTRRENGPVPLKTIPYPRPPRLPLSSLKLTHKSRNDSRSGYMESHLLSINLFMALLYLGPKRTKRLRLQTPSPPPTSSDHIVSLSPIHLRDEAVEKKKNKKRPCQCHLLDPDNNKRVIHYRSSQQQCLLRWKSAAEKKKLQHQIMERLSIDEVDEDSRSAHTGTAAAIPQRNIPSASAGPSNAPVVQEDTENYNEHASPSGIGIYFAHRRRRHSNPCLLFHHPSLRRKINSKFTQQSNALYTALFGIGMPRESIELGSRS